jgi:hypothetical protein
VLGAGARLFGETSDKKPMRLVDTQTVGGGSAFLSYERVRDAERASDGASVQDKRAAALHRAASGRAPRERQATRRLEQHGAQALSRPDWLRRHGRRDAAASAADGQPSRAASCSTPASCFGSLAALFTILPYNIARTGSPLPDPAIAIYLGVVAAAVALTAAASLAPARRALRASPRMLPARTQR